MTDPLTNPTGVAYPPAVQILAGHYFPDVDVDDAQQKRRHLVDALEAAIAADREHRPEQPDLDQDQLDRLVNVYVAGMGSGAATALMQLNVNHDVARELGLGIARRMLEDPIVHLQLEEMVTRMMTESRDQPPAWQRFTAYPRNHRDD